MQWENGKCCKGKWGHALLSFGLRAPASSRECRVRAQPLLFFRFISSREPLTLSGSCSWSISQSRLWGYSGQHCEAAVCRSCWPSQVQGLPLHNAALVLSMPVYEGVLFSSIFYETSNYLKNVTFTFFFFLNFLDSRHVFWEKPFAFRK